MARPQWLPLLDLLVCDPHNPRSVAFQLKGLHDFMRRIEEDYGDAIDERLDGALAAQQVHAHRIEVTPMPHETHRREDYFGNPVTQIMLAAPHATLSVCASSQVEVQAGSLPSACQDAEPWESLRERLHQGAGEAMLEPQQFLFESPHVELFRSLLEAARYVSGYILTAPPPGKPRLIGADASHAWVSVWCGSEDWVDLDPTNNCVVAEQHVTLAWGRDFSDVTPMRGVVLGGGGQELEVRVTVTPTPA